MEFDTNGYLKPYGLNKADYMILEEVFVNSFPESSTRKRIFEEYQQYNYQLHQLLPNGFWQWINGSFISKKLNPRDIDLVTFVDDSLFHQHEKQFASLRELRYKGSRLIDGYFITVYPDNHPHNYIYHLDCADWLFRFSTPKPKGNKGFLEINFKK